MMRKEIKQQKLIDRLGTKVRILEEMLEEYSREVYIEAQRRSAINRLLTLSLRAVSVDALLSGFLQTLLALDFLSIENQGAVFLVDERRSRLMMRAHHNFAPEQLSTCREVPLGRCLCGKAAETGEVLFASCNDPRHDVRYPDMTPHSHYIVPVCAGPHVLGLFCLYVPDSMHPNENDIAFFCTSADIMAGALQRLFYEKELTSYQVKLEEMVEEKIEELRLVERRYQSIFENSLDGIFQTTLSGSFITCNPALARMHGYSSPQELMDAVSDIGRQLYVDPEHRKILLQQVKKGPVTDFETRLYRKDGKPIWVLMSARQVHDPEIGEYLEGNILDITKRKEAEQALAAEKERLAVTLRSIGDGVITTDTAGRVVLLNKVAEELTGWSQEEAAGQPLEKVFHIIEEKSRSRCANPVEKVLKSGRITGLANHTILIARDGTERHIADSGAPIRDAEGELIGIVLVFRDVTEKRRLEAELIKSKKLESLSVLAGGIAHDFNNILAAILGNISLAEQYEKEGSKPRKLLDQAKKAALRAKELVQQLLTFSKGGEPIRKAASISEVIRESADFVLRGSNVACSYHFPEGLWLADIDANQISQVIQNLVINAKQAMPTGGTVEISCENVEIGAGSTLPVSEGRYIRVRVSDHGSGIPPDKIPMIFDPYFTTKPQGTGLGLAIVHSVIHKHGGYITVESRPGKGTEFTFWVPASQEEEMPEGSRSGSTATGSGRILVMDDDDLVAETARQMLEHLGYEVSVVRDGREAVELYLAAMEDGNPFTAVILDLTIPGGMGGEETVKRLLLHDPKARVLVASGYSNDRILANYRAYGFAGVLVKPFQLKELSQALHDLLAAEI